MEFRTIGTRLRARIFLVILACIIAAGAGLSVEYNVSSKGVVARQHPIGVGSAQLLVDSNPSTLATLSQDTTAQTLAARAPLYAEYGTGTAIKDKVASIAGVPVANLTMLANTDQIAPTASTNSAPAPDTSDFVTLTAESQSPLVKISSQAPTAATAQRLAAATASTLVSSIASLVARQSIHSTKQLPILRVVLRPLGAPYGTTVYQGPKIKKAVALGIGAFIVLIIVILLLDGVLAARTRNRPAAAAA